MRRFGWILAFKGKKQQGHINMILCCQDFTIKNVYKHKFLSLHLQPLSSSTFRHPTLCSLSLNNKSLYYLSVYYNGNLVLHDGGVQRGDPAYVKDNGLNEKS